MTSQDAATSSRFLEAEEKDDISNNRNEEGDIISDDVDIVDVADVHRAPPSSSPSPRPDYFTYEERAKRRGMRYTVTDMPSIGLCIFLGVQHYLTMLGATVLIPLLVTPAMGANLTQTAEVISTIFFVSGINTLVQTTIGDRLPIIQGGSFSYLPATFSIISNPSLQEIQDDSERFVETMRVLQGALIIVGIVQMSLGYMALVVPMLKYISPVIIAPVIATIGLSLYSTGFSNVSTCFAVGLVQIALTIIFSQYLKFVTICGYPIFALFPIILAIAITWSYAAILTAADVWDEGSECRTDLNTTDFLDSIPFIRIPYPFQWGAPEFVGYAIVPMLGSMLAGMIESIGDYYSCANLCGAPPPTPGILSRGLAAEGIGVFLSGLFGTAAGTTSYAENIGAISLTRVGSRVVVQCGAATMIVVGVVAKIAALLATMPKAMVGGIYCTVFGLIVAIGLSNLQYVDLNSERNLFIIGFSIFNALSIAGPAGYFSTLEENPFGDSSGAEIALALFSSPMVVCLIAAFSLDNTIPGTREERGMAVWDVVRDADINNDPEYIDVYALPLCLAKAFGNCSYLEYVSRGHLPEPPTDGYQAGRADIGELCCPCICGKREAARDGEEEEEEQQVQEQDKES